MTTPLAAMLLGLGLAAPATPPPAGRAVVLSTDIGAEVDDQWALTHLAISPEIDLRLIVSGHAPGLTPQRSARVAADTLAKLGLKMPPPIVPGSAGKLADRSTPSRNAGVDAILERSRGFDAANRLIVVVIGTATDVASALLIDPGLADRAEVVSMAFDAWPGGGDPWNVQNDVAAWQVLLASHIPLVVGDSAVTRRHLTLSVDAARARIGAHGPAGSDLANLVAAWVARQPKMSEDASGAAASWVIWDEVTTAYLLGMAKSEVRPRPRLRDDKSLDHSRPEGEVRWVTEIDSGRLWGDLAAKLDRAAAGR